MQKLPDKAQEIIDTLEKAGFEAWAVGGSVRDILMNRPTKGWDFTTNATPEEILRIFPDSFYDNQFGTVGIKIRSDEAKKDDSDDKNIVDVYEVTPYRSEKNYTDSRHPDVISWGKTVEEDLARRDFTINAIAFNGKTIKDQYKGQEDISKKIIKTVGNPDERFLEDALRLMRAVRIATQLGFFIEEETNKAIARHKENLRKISAERIRDELLKILASEFPADGILLLKNVTLLEILLPELNLAFSVPQKSPKRHHIYDVGTHCVQALRNCPSKDPIIRLATLLHDIGKPKTFYKDPHSQIITFYNHEVEGARMVRKIADRLRLSKKQSESLIMLVRWHQFSVDERQTDKAIRRFIRRVGKENLEDMLALRIGDRLGGGALETSWRLELFKKRLEDVQQQPFSVKDLAINGHDIMNILGIAPGPAVGNILETLFAQVEDETLSNTKDDLLKRAREIHAQLTHA